MNLMVQSAFEYIKFNNKGAPSTDFRLLTFMRDPNLVDKKVLNKSVNKADHRLGTALAKRKQT